MNFGGNIKDTNKGFYGSRGEYNPYPSPLDTPLVRSTLETSNYCHLKVVDYNSSLVISVIIAPRYNDYYTGIVLVLLLRYRGNAL